MKSRVLMFLFGAMSGAAFLGLGWFLDRHYNVLRILPVQVEFEAGTWRRGDATQRGRMYRAVVAHLESQRPTKEHALELLGPSGFSQSAYLNGADVYLVYQIDLGQRILGVPYLHKLGLAFHKDGTYSHSTVWD